MDANRFDALTRSLTATGSRRILLGTVLAGVLAALGLDSTEAKKKPCPPCKKRKKGKCKKTLPDGTACTGGTCQGGSCVAAAPPPPPAPTCGDGIKNGSETDVDCGGSCRRCPDGNACQVANDCLSGTCTGGICGPCTPAQLCGSDANGSCRCDQAFPSGEPVCDTGPMSGLSVDDCAKCPMGTETCVAAGPAVRNCYKRCGSP